MEDQEYKPDKYKLDVIESLLKQGIPMGTVFDKIIENPKKYCYPKQVTYILNNMENYIESVDRLRLKEAYMAHLGGPGDLKFLFAMGFPEALLTKYVLYPRTYQFRTHMPFLDNIKLVTKFPKSVYCPSPILEELLGVRRLDTKRSHLHVVRYAYKPEGGTEFVESNDPICGTFYYPEPNSDIILKFNSCLIVPNKVVAYRYLTNASLEDIASDMVGMEDVFETYLLGPSMLNSNGDGFKAYYVDLDETDLKHTYKIMEDKLSTSYDELILMLQNIFTIPRYFEDLVRVETLENESDNEDETEREEKDSFVYKYQDIVQDKDFVIFLVSYTRYRAVRMMLEETWNWRVRVFTPYSYYDQIICNRAREEDIDLIILVTESSTGMYPIRTEILDTRARNVSLDHLYMKDTREVLHRLEMEKIEYEEVMSKLK